jgi:hypothetical protein
MDSQRPQLDSGIDQLYRGMRDGRYGQEQTCSLRIRPLSGSRGRALSCGRSSLTKLVSCSISTTNNAKASAITRQRIPRLSDINIMPHEAISLKKRQRMWRCSSWG